MNFSSRARGVSEKLDTHPSSEVPSHRDVPDNRYAVCSFQGFF
jgi:hypothetical protein